MTPQIRLWLIAPEGEQGEERLATFRAWLDEEEARRLDRFRFEADRHTFLIAHALTRAALSRCAQEWYGDEVAPHRWRFSHNAYGRPALADPPLSPPITFNLSHTRGLVACLVCAGERAIPCGVDVEWLQRSIEPLRLAAHAFAPAELRVLANLVGEEQRRRFFCYWTLKEAYVKARGRGLALGTKRFALDLSQARPRLVCDAAFDDPGRWWLQQQRHRQHALAVALGVGAEAAIAIQQEEHWPLSG